MVQKVQLNLLKMDSAHSADRAGGCELLRDAREIFPS